MAMRYLAAAIISLSLPFFSAWASNPGEPLSVEDWQILDPSITIGLAAARNDSCANPGANNPLPETDPVVCGIGALWEYPRINRAQDRTGNSIDAAGMLWTWRSIITRTTQGNPLTCGATPQRDTQLVRCVAPDSCTVVAEVSVVLRAMIWMRRTSVPCGWTSQMESSTCDSEPNAEGALDSAPPTAAAKRW